WMYACDMSMATASILFLALLGRFQKGSRAAATIRTQIPDEPQKSTRFLAFAPEVPKRNLIFSAVSI
ncbi:MAG: hypothetical protein LDL33_03350, partial [Desulfomonile sp.]|nr:hypothetical protein [Desulfomonile sp.]